MIRGEACDGGHVSRDRVAKSVNFEPCRKAHRLIWRERADHTLSPGGLVTEAFDDDVLNNHAKNRGATKRAGERRRVPSADVLDYYEGRRIDVITRNEAIDRLAERDERQGLVIALRFFAGLSVPGVGEGLDVSVATVEGDRRLARAWLPGQLKGAVA
jgi:DNA-directed RNA polymerase specialized sigma24 family protein